MSRKRSQAAVEAPPHDLDAEGVVLSALLIAPDRLRSVEFLRPSHFYSDANRKIAEAIWALAAEGGPVDVVLVATRLRNEGRIAAAGGTPYLAQLTDATPAVANLPHHARIVVEHARRRALVNAAQIVAVEARDPSTDVDGLLYRMRSRLDEVQGSGTAERILHGGDLAADLAPLEYLVPGIGLVAGGGAPHEIVGYGFSGKTLAAQSMLLALAAGSPVWGGYPVQPRRVAHVDLEQGERLTRTRYQRLALAMDVDLSELGDALALTVFPRWTLSSGCSDRWLRLMQGRDLLLVDSLRAACPGADENSSEFRSGLDLLGQLSEQTGCRALVLHHARKPNQDESGGGRFAIRGSGAIYDGADAVYLFAAEKGEPVRVEHLKARSAGEPVEDFALTIADVAHGVNPRAGLAVRAHGIELVEERREARQEAVRAGREAKDAETVRRALEATPGLGVRELRTVAHLSGDRLAAALAVLGDDVEVRTEAKGMSRVSRHYLTRNLP